VHYLSAATLPSYATRASPQHSLPMYLSLSPSPAHSFSCTLLLLHYCIFSSLAHNSIALLYNTAFSDDDDDDEVMC
jgi:hypothetical protein